ncbi:MAG: hypothetical protein KKD44_29375 [Proteobacteria bacterium]|nr:hypothetical protein [Pseudomonadota bacterium]
MTGKSKRKGNSFEYEIVNKAKAFGIDAVRAFSSDGRAMGEAKEVDVVIGSARIQAKRRKKLPEYLKIDDGVDAVVFREDRGETYVLVRFDKVLKLIKEGAWK